ncbi:MAG: hypothetical protein JNL11_10910 [Bdellovibrionaceae bacterium]|nr:hypothetical protein [Pseudobdellovibrionaceae bacterium]
MAGSRMNTNHEIASLLPRELKNLVTIEYSKIADFHWFNLVSEKNESLISDRVFTGFDKDMKVAFSKAVSEMTERLSFNLGHKAKLRSCATQRSDGIAAYPIANDFALAAYNARENALNEAIERYAWATWWDQHQVKYKHEKYLLQDFCLEYKILKKLLIELDSILKIEFIHFIEPEILNSEKKLVIVIAEFNGGVVTGGACDDKGKLESILIRSFSELLRHALVLIQNKQKPIHLSDYENRLLYFASMAGKDTFYNRLSQKGTLEIDLPNLAVDEQIPSVKTHFVHRCLFQNQPPFIDENYERMCL